MILNIFLIKHKYPKFLAAKFHLPHQLVAPLGCKTHILMPTCPFSPLNASGVVLQTLISNPRAFHWLVSDVNYELMVSEQADDSPSAITS